MARIRTIKPEFWTSEQLAECSPSARLLFIGLWSFSDCRGVHPASESRLKMEVFPGDPFTARQVGEWIGELIRVGLVRLFTAEGKQYWAVTGWHHQKIDRPAYKYPAPPLAEDSSDTRRILDQSHPPEGMGRGGDGEGKEVTRTVVPKTHVEVGSPREGESAPQADPTPALFAAYCRGADQSLRWSARWQLACERIHAAGLTPADTEAAARHYRSTLSAGMAPSLDRFAAQPDRWLAEADRAQKPTADSQSAKTRATLAAAARVLGATP